MERPDQDESVRMPPLARDLQGADIAVRKEEGELTRLTFPVSSETPVERYFGDEVLSHDKSAIRLDRVKRGAMPLLFNHNWDDPIGVIDKARIENSRLVVDAHLFDTARAQEVDAMVRGGLRNVSIGYRLHVVEEDKKANTFTARDWEPFEVSIVTVPADPSVGIGRAADGDESVVRFIRTVQQQTEAKASSTPAVPATHRKETSMSVKTEVELAAEAEAAKEKVRREERERQEVAEREARAELAKTSALDLEKGRVAAIRNLAKANNIADNVIDKWIRGGSTLEQVSEDILSVLEERGKTNPQPAAKLGLTQAETKNYSLGRAILALQDQDWGNASFELECSQALATKLGRALDKKTVLVPFDVLARPVDTSQFDAMRALGSLLGKRDMTVASAGAGGYLVGTDNMGFIEILRNRSVAFAMGVRRLSGLQGNVTVPRQSAAATAYWLANEATPITESGQTFVQMALTPKTCGAYTEISRLLLLQSSPGAEGIVTDDLAQVVALGADLAVLNGSGSAGQPTGIINTSGIGAVAGAAVDYAKVLEFQTDVATSNVRPSRGGYVTTPASAAILMQRSRFANTDTPLWVGNIWEGQMAGFPGMSSNQMPAATMTFGDWPEAVVGEWGVLELSVNPFANFQAGIIGVRAIYSMDVGVRRPFAFSHGTSIS